MNPFQPQPWYLIHTKPCQEKRAAENLAVFGIETFTPWLAGRGAARIQRPLFAGYIFARFSCSILAKVRFTHGVSYVVAFGGRPAVVDNIVIAAIRSRIDEHGMVTHAVRFRPGDVVQVQAGPMRDFVGIFEKEMPGRQRAKILLATVAYTARVDTSIFDLAKLTSKAGTKAFWNVPASMSSTM